MNKQAEQAGSPPATDGVATLPEPTIPEPAATPVVPDGASAVQNDPATFGAFDPANFEPEDMTGKVDLNAEPEDPAHQLDDLPEHLKDIKLPEEMDKEPAEPKEDEPQGNDYLRTEVKRHAQEAKDAQAALDAFKVEREADAVKWQESITAKEKALEEATKAQAVPDVAIDPWEAQEVTNLIQPWQKRVDSLANSLDLANGTGGMLRGEQGNTLMKMFANVGDSASEGYEERRSEVNEFLNEHFPDDKREVSQVMSEGVEMWTTAAAKVQDIEQNMEHHQVKAAQEAYRAAVDVYKNDVGDNYGRVPDELKRTQPHHPDVVIEQFTTQDDTVKARATQIKDFLEYAQTPLPPLTNDELGRFNSTDEQQAYIQQRTAQKEAARAQLTQKQYTWAMSHQILPVVVKQLAEANARLDALGEGQPRPNSQADDKPKSREVQPITDFSNFEPTDHRHPF